MNAIFMIEGGRALVMIKEHIAEKRRVQDASRALARELGASQYIEDRTNGVLLGVIFDGNLHPDFKKPTGRHGTCYPKKGTVWAKRLAEQEGYKPLVKWISGEFGIPLNISYSYEGGSGSGCIGNPFTECGFLYISANGPYAMWVPDIQAIVADHEARGHIVEEPAKSFRFESDGCRRIEQEEWNILVLQKKLDEKKKMAVSSSNKVHRQVEEPV